MNQKNQNSQAHPPQEVAMKKQSTIHPIIAGLPLLMMLQGTAWAGDLPLEPSDAYLIHEDVNIMSGLYTREYSLPGSGQVDYKTARQIVLSEYNEYWNTVVETKEYPLFYGYDANHDGHFEMWVDRQVEGCSCDIQPYETLKYSDAVCSHVLTPYRRTP